MKLIFTFDNLDEVRQFARDLLKYEPRPRGESRHAEIVQLLNDGKKPADIATELGLTRQTVYGVRSRARMDGDLPKRDRTTARESKAEAIRTLTLEGKSAQEIARTLGVHAQTVYSVRSTMRRQRLIS